MLAPPALSALELHTTTVPTLGVHERVTLINGVLTLDGVEIFPIFGSQPAELTFDELLTDVLGYTKDEAVSICHQVDGGRFITKVVRASAALAAVAKLPAGADVWFGVNPVPLLDRDRRGKGRGCNEDVLRLAALAADLDVKPGGCASYDVAYAIVDKLSQILGTRPVAIVNSGHGLHPYWVIDPDGDDPDEDDRIDAPEPPPEGALDPAALLTRWKLGAQTVAKSLGANADSVFDLVRVLRVPGTFNHKAVTNGDAPVAVTCHRDSGRPLTLLEIHRRLDDYGIHHIDDRPDPDAKRGEPGYAKVVSNPGEWTFADSTCSYMTETIDGWATDHDAESENGLELGKGRHQWLCSASVRLHCAKALGDCISETDFEFAKTVVAEAFRTMRATRDPIKPVTDIEIEDAWTFGEKKAATKNKTEARKELGGHKHTASSGASQATQLVRLALECYELGVTPEDSTFGYDPATPHVTMGLKSRKFGLQSRLAADYYDKTGIASSTAAQSAAMNTLEGKARQQQPTRLHQRVAGDQNAVYIDMADEDNRVIEISGGDWRIVTESPHKFRRTELTAAMPEPKRGDWKDSVLLLWKYVNIFKENYAVVLAILVDALINPASAKPVVSLVGHSGTAKTSSGRCFVALIDPSTAALQSPPKDLQEWLTTASGSYVVGLDNLSKMPSWLSDAICCAATGDAVVKRQLYTDGDLHVVSLLRSVIFTGISFSGLRGDLSERLVSLDLKEITMRTPESELKEAWLTDRPVIFGGLLDLAAKVHAMLPTLAMPEPLPRMADFGKVLLAVDENTGSDGMMQYRGRLKRVLADSATGDVFIGHLVDTRYDTGPDGKTSSQILADIDGKRAETAASLPLSYPPEWPRDPRTVTSRLKHNEVSLRSIGWEIDNDGGKNQSNAAKWFIHPPHEQTR